MTNLRWQEGKPTEPGWYWIKGASVYMVHVYKGATSRTLRVEYSPFDSIDHPLDGAWASFVTHFSGPISEPES